MHAEKRRKIAGVVTSNKMDKTVVVRVDTQVMNPVVKKRVRRSKKFFAHDQLNRCGIGDRVLMIETRPLSKLKRWAIVEVIEKAK